MKKQLIGLALLCLSLTGARAQKPAIREYVYSDKVVVSQMSDNGQWLVATNGENVTRLVNLTTGTDDVIGTEEAPFQGKDVTNDGSLVVGSKDGAPATYSTATHATSTLECPRPYTSGNAFSVTPDGTLACGVIYQGEGYMSRPALWNLSTGKLIDCEGLPTKDMAHLNQNMQDFRSISADGQRLLGCMSYSYLPAGEDAGGCFYFVYDRQTKTSKAIGFTENAIRAWTPQAQGLIVIMEATMSNNGLYVTGQAHVCHEIEGNEFGEEIEAPFRYDVANNQFTLYDSDPAVQGAYGTAVTNDGVVLAATPAGNPIREWSVMGGKYWYSFNEILSQKYGMTFKNFCQSENTGTPVSVTDDGLRLACFPDPYSTYVAELPVAVTHLADGMKLLGSYTASPREGSHISHLKTATVTFTRDITAVGGANSAQIIDADDNVLYNSVGFTANGKQLTVRFRTGTLAPGHTYYLYIPEGTVALADDPSQTNTDITVEYAGREDAPVELLKAYPADGATLARLDYQTNPIVLTFADHVFCPATASAVIYRNDEATPYARLQMMYGDSLVMAYPTTTLYLFDGNDYRVEIADSSITDVAGNNPSARITLHYHGSYVREIAADDVMLFSDGFQTGTNAFMQWDGDMNQPTAEMQDLDFQKGLAWTVVLDNYESGDYAAASTSQYTPAGRSDDWLVTPQLYIPDMLCSLRFLSQSYRMAKQDSLKVVVWESNNVYNELTADIVARMKAEGTVIYDRLQTPGKSEDDLAGDWLHNDLSLAAFAGKNVYIAFVNQNTDQSCVFLDSVEVRHEMSFLTALDYDQSVVAQTGTTIGGTITGNNATQPFHTLTLTLKDAEGNAVDSLTASGLTLARGDQYRFAFTKPLPLAAGVENKFSVLVKADADQNEVYGTVKNLAFQPTRRVVIEEFSGRACGNCPLGIVAFEKLQQRYGDQFIPVCLRTYNNDPASAGLAGYSSALGLSAAPSGVVNRGTPCYPAVSATVGGKEHFYFTVADLRAAIGDDVAGADYSDLWADAVEKEMATPAEADITATCDYDPTADQFNIATQVRYALNASKLSVNLFVALVEDQVSVRQSNYFATVPTKDIGEWGLGGKYGQATVSNYLMDDVCRGYKAQAITGTGGYIPADVAAGEAIESQQEMKRPAIVDDPAQCKAVVMMIDANTGRVINAAVAKTRVPDAIKDVNSQQSTVNSCVYDLAGRRVTNPKHGVYVVGGRKVVVK